MDNVKRIAALYLVLTALAVFFNLILTPVYHDGSPDYPVWKIVNYFMAAGDHDRPCHELPAKALRGQPRHQHCRQSLGQRILLCGHSPGHALLLGMDLDPQPRQRDRRSRHLPPHLLSSSRRSLCNRHPGRGALAVEEGVGSEVWDEGSIGLAHASCNQIPP